MQGRRGSDGKVGTENTAVQEALKVFESLPEFPSSQVWMRDRQAELTSAATGEWNVFGSKARARFALSQYNIRAAAFNRLVSTIELQKAFMPLLDYMEQAAWIEFIGFWTPTEIRSGAPSIAPGIARRKRWWIRQAYKRLQSVRQRAPRKKRGRPTIISDKLKLQALGVRGGKARAKILYGTLYPSSQQVKNVASILRHFERTRGTSE